MEKFTNTCILRLNIAQSPKVNVDTKKEGNFVHDFYRGYIEKQNGELIEWRCYSHGQWIRGAIENMEDYPYAKIIPV